MIHDNLLTTVGNTPLVRLNRISEGLDCTLVAKIEALNPAGSVKDRTAARIVADAERRGLLRPGGTIVEATSGNMGVGLSFCAAVQGYRSIVVTTDKQSEDKVNLVRAFGAEVRICPTAVEPDDPRSFYSVATKIAEETPGAFFANQFHNLENPEAHYTTTGPEIWEATEGKVDVLVGGLGTGGTICGAGRYLKEKNPDIQIVGVDPHGSLFYDYFHTKETVPAGMYHLEGIGEDIFPATLDFGVLDDCVQVQDKESFLMARRMAREEGILAGGSSGAALVGAIKYAKAKSLPAGTTVVFIVCERGERALGKVYNDEWMRRNQYLGDVGSRTAEEILTTKPREIPRLVTLEHDANVSDAIEMMQEMDVSQIPVLRDGTVVGTLRDDQVIDLLLHAPERRSTTVDTVMDEPLPEVGPGTPLDDIQDLIVRGHTSVLVTAADGSRDILTKYDLIRGLARS